MLRRTKKRLHWAAAALYFQVCCAATRPGNRGSGQIVPPPKPGETTMLTAEQMMAAQRANVETLFGLTNKAFEGVEKLVELNL